LLAVADGMGGENAGEIASAIALSSLRAALAAQFSRDDPESALRAAVVHADEAVKAAAAAVPGRAGMGATLVAVVVEGERAHIASVGDSRVYVLRGDSLVQVTKDQSMLQHLIDSGGISPDRIANYPYKGVVLQAVGRAQEIAVPVGRMALRRDDLLLLCSDGLSGQVEDEEIREILLSTTPLDAACARLVAAANERGGRDNITAVLASIGGDGLRERADGETVDSGFVSMSAKGTDA